MNITLFTLFWIINYIKWSILEFFDLDYKISEFLFEGVCIILNIKWWTIAKIARLIFKRNMDCLVKLFFQFFLDYDFHIRNNKEWNYQIIYNIYADEYQKNINY